MKEKIKIIIVDDQSIFRESIILSCSDADDISFIAEAGNGKKLLTMLPNLKPDIIMLDVEMPVMDGTKTLENIMRDYNWIKVIMFSQYDGKTLADYFYNMGASAFMDKIINIEDMINTIRAVFFNKYNRKNVLKIEEVIFTKRELEMIPLICGGKQNKEIADELFINIKTVETHRHNLFLKTNCKNVVEFVNFCRDRGLHYLR
jgi:two-component system response regulator DegU